MSGDRITSGKLVSLTYSILDENGRVVEQQDAPVQYIHGGDVELIGGTEKAVEGKQAGDRVRVELPPDAFGPYEPSLTFTDDLENVPEQFRRIGAEVPMENDAGETRTFYVARIENGKLTVDGNHPLAGRTLTLKVVIQEVRDATREDAMALAGGPTRLH